AVVEPLRDDLVTMIVTSALRRAVADPNRAGSGAVARITHQAEIVRDSVAGLLAIGLTFVFMVVSALIGLATLVPAVLPSVAVPMVVSLVLFGALLPSMATRQRNAVVGEEAMAQAAATALTGLRDVVACGAESQVQEVIAARVSAQAAALRAVARLNVVRTLCLAVGGWMPLILVLAQTPWLLRHGTSPAAVVGAVTYISGVLQSALYMLTRGVSGSGVRLAITLQRIFEAAGEPAPGPAAEDASAPEAPDGSGLDGSGPGGTGVVNGGSRVSLRGVCFAYGPHAEPVLRDLDLDVPDGDHLAVVGPSGIGKSTLAGLIAGLLRPAAGQVWLSGRAVPGIPAAGLPGYRVLIPQEAYVFTGTLGENLRYLAPDTAAEQLDAAVAAVGLGALVTRLGGYQAELSPDRLSAGERQLVALARAHLSPARLAILDEATCHLDPAAAARAESAFASRPGALIVIAHRMSSALRARRVLVLDGARAAIGDHAALLATSPMYRDLVGQWHEGRDPVPPHPGLRLTPPSQPASLR
ncbi:MAG TPA: ABC transporter ATP-binding protein, partial [Streptosporangiaceae bacterium]|nr:ABC transporter ATP-binding protein [Streptosporangiaceae bacterium]